MFWDIKIKKMLMVLILGIFLISFTSALEFDNTYEYFPEVEVAVIHNCDFWVGFCLNEGEELATLELTWGDTKVPRGIDVHVGTFLFTPTSSTTDALQELGLTNLKNGQVMTRGKQFKVKTIKQDDNYIQNCSDIWNETNQTYSANCELVENGTIDVEEWIPLSNPNFEFEANVEYEIGVFVDVEEGDRGDWIPQIMGVQIEEWAEWTESLNTDLTSYYKLDESSGTVIDNVSSNNGANNGAQAGVTGQINTAYDIDANEGISIAGAGTSPFDFTGDFSVSLWVKPNSFGGAQNMLGNNVLGAGNGGWILAMLNTGQVYFQENRAGSPNYPQTRSSTTLSTGSYQHVVMVKTGTSPKLYIGGTEVSYSIQDTHDSSVTSSNTQFQIGSTNDADEDLAIDEIGLWDRALTTSEITQLYNGGAGISWTDIFGFAPSVTLTSPVNGANLTSASVDHITTVTDDERVEWVAFYLDGVLEQNSTTHVNGSYTFTETVTEGNHTWHILASDNTSLTNQSANWTYNYTQPPIYIDLLNPTDTSTHNIPSVNVSCRAYKDEGVTQLNLTINGIVNETITNSTPGQNLTIEGFKNFSEGNYTWGCSALNPSTSAVSSNRTFEVLYSTPIITLITPLNDSTSLTEETTFTFNATDTNGIKNVTLYVDGSPINSSVSGVNGSYSFTNIIASGEHTWTVYAYSILDKIGTTTPYDFVIHSIAPTVNITSPSGAEDSIIIGENETLIYNISEAGENLTEHLDECWYIYGDIELCYQESANTSNQTGIDGNCNLNYSGTYEIDGNWNNPANTYDGSRATYGNWVFLDDPDQLFINYTKPKNSIKESEWNLWVSTGRFRYDIPETCWNLDNEKLSLRIDSRQTSVRGYCLGEGGWWAVASLTSTSGRVYEDAMDWQIVNPLNCTGTTTEFLYEEGYNNITVFAKDIYGLTGNDTSTWEYKIIEVNQSYSNETTEGSREEFLATIKLGDSYTITDAVILNYNGVEYSGQSFVIGDNVVLRKQDLFIPNVDSKTNLTFYWTITLSDSSQVNLTFQNQTVNAISLDNCSNFTNQLLNFTVLDEETQLEIPNATIEVAVNIYSQDRSFVVLNLSEIHENTNNARVCISTNLSSSSFYSMDSIVRYEHIGGANEYYNIFNSTVTQGTESQNIYLYDLNETDSTEFQLTFTGSDFLPIENALVYVDRQYISENKFKTVELPKTDYNGQAVLHLVRNDVIYNIRIIKEGVVLGNFENLVAFCDDFTIGDCNIELNAFDSVENVFNYDDSIGIIFSNPVYSETEDEISFNFVTSDGSAKTVELVVTRNDIFGNRSICNASLISSGGTLTCSIDPNLDESILKSSIYVDDILQATSSVQLDSENYGVAGYLVMFVMALSFIFMFSGSKTGVLISIGLTLAGSIGLGLTSGNLIGLGASGLWLLVIIFIGIYKLNSQRAS